MKKRFTFLLLAIGVFISNSFQAQELATKSLTNFGNSGPDILSDMTFDSEGNYYITGTYSGIFNIDGEELESQGQRDIFLVKFTADNELEWKTRIGGIGDEHAYSIVCDNENSIYLAGVYSQNINGSTNPALGITDLFLMKYNSAGVHQWTETVSSTAPARKSFLRKDADGNIWLIGNFSKQITINEEANNALAATNIYAAKYNPAGEVQARFYLNNANPIVLKDVVIDSDNYFYFAGYFEEKVELGGFNFDAIGKKDAFIAKYNSSGVVSWLKVAGSYYNDQANSISLDPNGYVLVAGDFKDEISFIDAATTKIKTTKSNEVFIASYINNSEGQLQWAKELGGNSSNYSSSITMAENDKFYMSGTFKGELRGGAAPINSLKQSKDIFLGRFDTQGNEESINQAGGENEDFMQINYLAPSSSILVGGQFTTDFNLISETITNKNYQDVFFGQLVDCDAFPKVELPENVSICGDSYIIDAGGGFDAYYWNETPGSRTMTVTTSGTYTVLTTQKNGCTSTGTIDVTINQAAIVELGPDKSASAGEFIYLDAGPAYQTYTWNTGYDCRLLCVPISELEIDLPTKFSVTVTHQNGCTAEDNIFLTRVETTQPVAMVNTQEPTIKVSTTTTSSPIQENDEQKDNSIKVPADFKIYPNPTNGELTILIPWPEKVKFINIYNIRGNLIKSIKGPTNPKLELDFSNYTKGTYLVKVIGVDEQEQLKVIRN